MQKVISVNNMRESDSAAINNGIPSIELMERAGISVVKAKNVDGKIAIICGTGNNAGDGFVIALELNKRHFDVTIFLIEEKFSDSGSFFFNKCKESNIKIKNVSIDTKYDDFDYIYDCLLGTGFKGKLKQEYVDIINKINNLKAKKISVDIPSGLNGDSGLCCPIAVKAYYTISINTLKPGLFLNQAKDYCGEVINVDIGIKELKEEYYLVEDSDFLRFVQERDNYSHKGSYGYVGIIGGCKNYSGATKISNMSLCSLRAGAGVSRLIIPNSISYSIMPFILESTLFELSTDNNGDVLFVKDEIDKALRGLKAIGIGPGWGDAEANYNILEYILKTKNLFVCIDADGLNTLSKNIDLLLNTTCKVCLTPHLKEMSRLTGLPIKEIESNPINIAKDFAHKYNCIVVLKGPTSIITDGLNVYLSNTGNQGMATAGSGDVLTGIITGVIGYEHMDILSISYAVYLNGLAGDIAADKYTDIAMLSTDTIKCIPDAIKMLRN